jgi:hypothetical protein
MKRDELVQTTHLGYVYWVGPQDRGPVKIGWARNPHKRVSELQTGHPEELVVLALIPGSRSNERNIHRELASSRIRGEWFDRDAALSTAERLGGLPGSTSRYNTTAIDWKGALHTVLSQIEADAQLAGMLGHRPVPGRYACHRTDATPGANLQALSDQDYRHLLVAVTRSFELISAYLDALENRAWIQGEWERGRDREIADALQWHPESEVAA